MNLGEKLTRARGAGIPWVKKNGVQRFFTIAGPIIYVVWGILLIFATLVAAVAGLALENNKPRRR